MAKMTKDELIKKVVEVVSDEDVQISLIEDITDSMDVQDDSEKESLLKEIEDVKSELAELKRKYKERFMSGDVEEVKPEDETEELQEEEVIDIKEI